MRAVFIVNPEADRGRARKVWDSIDDVRQDLFPSSEVLFTEYPGHAQDIASAISKDHCEMLVSVGGDGTVHEIVNGIAGRDFLLGIIPAGSGNDLARTLGITKDHKQALLNLIEKCEKTIDIGTVGDRYFINIGGVGFDAEVVADMNNKMRFLRGTAAYVASVVKKLLTFSPVDLTITIDGNPMSKKVYMCAVANGRFYGGGMMLAPVAKTDDGLFDICILENLSKIEFLITFPQVFKGTHVNHPKVKFYKGREILIEGPGHLSIQADGEVFGKLPVRFQVLPKALRIAGIGLK